MTKQTNGQTCETPATSEEEIAWTKWRFDKRLGKRKLEQHNSDTVFVKIEPVTGDEDKSIEYWRKDEDSRSFLEKIG